MLRSAFVTITCLLVTVSFSQETFPKTILGIFAHPDDENMIGDVLAKYARQGAKVYVIIATDGKFGTRVTAIPEGDSLGKIRKQESVCACKALGIQPPIFLSIERLDTKIGVRAYLENHKTLLKGIRNYIDSLNPDVLITFGPDGEYGHSEHIVTGASVTEVLLKEGWVEKYPLYFFAWKKIQIGADNDLSYVDDKYLDVQIAFSEEDETKSMTAARCYVTQYTPKEMDELIEEKKKDKINKLYFRKFIAPANGKLKTVF